MAPKVPQHVKGSCSVDDEDAELRLWRLDMQAVKEDGNAKPSATNESVSYFLICLPMRLR